MLDLKRVSHASLFLLAFSLVRTALSVAVKSSTALFFGAASATDAYFAAFTIPQQIGDFLFGGIFFLLVIPLFNKRKQEAGEQVAFEEINLTLNLSFAGLVVITVLYFAAAPLIIHALFPGFPPDVNAQAILFARLFSPAVLLMGLSLVYASLYHIHKDFTTPTLAGLLFPVSSLAAMWLLPDSWGISRLIFGNLAGMAAGLVIMMLAIRRKFKWNFRSWRLSNQLIRQMAALSWPIILAVLMGRVVALVERNAASLLREPGMITMLEYSFFIFNFIIAFGTQPLLTAVFPVLSEQFNENDHRTVAATFTRTLRILLFLCVPFTAFFAIQSTEIVELVFKYGKFTEQQSSTCSRMLLILSTAAVTVAVDGLVGRMLLAIHSIRFINLLRAFVEGASIPLYYVASGYWGIYGIVATSSLFYFVMAVCGLVVLSRHNRAIEFSSVALSVLRLLIPCGVMALVMCGVIHLMRGAPSLGRFAAVSGVGVCSFVLIAALMKVEELGFIAARIPFLGLLRKTRG